MKELDRQRDMLDPPRGPYAILPTCYGECTRVLVDDTPGYWPQWGCEVCGDIQLYDVVTYKVHFKAFDMGDIKPLKVTYSGSSLLTNPPKIGRITTPAPMLIKLPSRMDRI